MLPRRHAPGRRRAGTWDGPRGWERVAIHSNARVVGREDILYVILYVIINTTLIIAKVEATFADRGKSRWFTNAGSWIDRQVSLAQAFMPGKAGSTAFVVNALIGRNDLATPRPLKRADNDVMGASKTQA